MCIENEPLFSAATHIYFTGRVSVTPKGCWEWRGTRDKDGYGIMSIKRRNYRAHRWAYQSIRGEIPQGLVIDHLCRNRACCNPEHLEPVTVGENCRRGETVVARNLAKTECAKGHSFSGGNLYIDPRGFRGCKACRREAVARSTLKRGR